VPGPEDALDGPLPARKFYRLNLSQYGEDVERVAQAMLWAGACSAVGWVLGFLFGIPRTLSGQPDQPARQATAGVQEASESGAPAKGGVSITSQPSAVNTNLEQVSEWLTKFLVGVSLVELSKVKAALTSAAVTIAAGFGGAYWESFTLALMIYFSVTGFLGSYLLTRLFLQKLLTNPE